jgi:hypothetical protein
VFVVDGIYDDKNNTFYFQLIGYGPDGPKEKFVLKGSSLIRYTLTNDNRWLIGYHHKKQIK